jgi:hypothetical protein
LLALVGMVFGITMGIQQNFMLAPSHAHLNLVGFAMLFLAGLYYRLVPEAEKTILAKVHAALAVTGRSFSRSALASCWQAARPWSPSSSAVR